MCYNTAIPILGMTLRSRKDSLKINFKKIKNGLFLLCTLVALLLCSGCQVDLQARVPSRVGWVQPSLEFNGFSRDGATQIWRYDDGYGHLQYVAYGTANWNICQSRCSSNGNRTGNYQYGTQIIGGYTGGSTAGTTTFGRGGNGISNCQPYPPGPVTGRNRR